jgi:DNA gyrase subunit A
MKEVAKELTALREKFSDKRRTEIVYNAKEFSIEDMIANEDVIITITHQGFIKRTVLTNYRRQGRGGRGVSGAAQREEDYVEMIFQAATHHYLMFFTDRGRCYRIKVYDIPEGARNARGRSIANLLQKDNSERITAVLPVKEFGDDRFIMMTTKEGTTKKVVLSEFERVNVNGKIAIDLDEKDRLIGVRITDGTCDVLIGTKFGMACRFRESDVRAMGRTAAGVRGIDLQDGDEVVSMVAVKRADAHLVIVGEKGYGKRTSMDDFRLTKRGAKGVISMNLTEKTGNVVAIMEVNDTDDLVVMSTGGIVIRQALKDIRVIGRNTQGVRLIRLDEGDAIVDIAVVTRDEDEDAETTDTTDGTTLPVVPEGGLFPEMPPQ